MSNKNAVEDYLESFNTLETRERRANWPRVHCCGTSRSLYCPECFSLLIPRSDCPLKIDPLPFDLNVILHDRRSAATGIHLKVLHKNYGMDSNQVEVYDLERMEPLPEYFPPGTYLLFPSDNSIPLEKVSKKINTLIVLDCKWTKSSSRDHPRLANLPRVHLSNPSHKSFFWRWHSAGPHCLSTVEAIHEAACEVTHDQGDSEKWLPWLYLFGLQRAAANISEKNKSNYRETRRTAGKEKQKRDKERGKALSKQHKREVSEGVIMGKPRKPKWQIHAETTI
mmetsp:Transcript_26015/g.39380  ORF Transcript_26015/g.39380 Transcript_26015/m.39380 type:complete len:281 (-) Transcript_26015:781-1623(-)